MKGISREGAELMGPWGREYGKGDMQAGERPMMGM